MVKEAVKGKTRMLINRITYLCLIDHALSVMGNYRDLGIGKFGSVSPEAKGKGWSADKKPSSRSLLLVLV